MRSAAVRPLPRAKPSAAFVGLPSASKAIFAAGPFERCVSASVVSATSSTAMMMRRGVEQVFTPPWAMRASSRAASVWETSFFVAS